jgi:hypothetical protein
MATSGEVLRLRAAFYRLGELYDASEPVNFFVKKRTNSAEVEGPFLGVQLSTGIWEYQYTTGTSGTYDYSVVTADGVIEEGEFTVKRRRTA